MKYIINLLHVRLEGFINKYAVVNAKMLKALVSTV